MIDSEFDQKPFKPKERNMILLILLRHEIKRNMESNIGEKKKRYHIYSAITFSEVSERLRLTRSESRDMSTNTN